MANRIKLTDRARETFLKCLEETANVSEAASVAGFARSYAYEYRKEHTDFAADWDAAIEVAVDKLEREARRRAIEGWEEPVFHKGKECGRVRKYSDRMLEILLKAHRPEKYKERTEHKHTFSLEDLVAGDE